MSGWRLLLTRPTDECVALSATLSAEGIASSSLPLLAIEPLPETPEQRAAMLELDRYCAVVVVSKPAARLGLGLLDRYWPQPPSAPVWFSVGGATGTLLKDHGLDASWPLDADDSEALLALPRFNEVLKTAAQPKVLILRGEGGREHLTDTLRERGVQVDRLELYRRYLPEYPPGTLVETLRSQQLNGLVVSSGQGLESLHALAGSDWPELCELPLFVPSPRVAKMAAALGAKRIVDCRGAGTAALLVALRATPVPAHNAKDGNVSESDSDKSPRQPSKQNPVTPESKTPPSQAAGAAQAGKTSPSQPKVEQKGGRGALAGLALLVALAGLGAGCYSVWQLQQLAGQESLQVEDLQSANRQQMAQFSEQTQQLASRLTQLERLPTEEQLGEQRRLLAQLQADQQRLSGRVEQVLGASREQWQLAEAEHLLRMAMLRLSAMQDVNSAVSLVEEADLILRRQDDPGAYAARQKMLEGLEALRSLPELDRTGLFLQLGALGGQANQLSALAPEFQLGQAGSESLGESRLQQWLDELTRYIRIDFNAGTDVKPLLAGQSLAQVRLALSLAIEQAQWAVLNGNTEVYRQSLAQAVRLIEDHFNEDNGQSRGLRDRIEALSSRQVAVTLPDLAPALQTLQAYVQKRQNGQSDEPDKADEAPAGEDEQPNEEDLRT